MGGDKPSKCQYTCTTSTDALSMHTQPSGIANSCHTDKLQETALRSESQLEATRRSLIELDEDKQAGKEEAESARYPKS